MKVSVGNNRSLEVSPADWASVQDAILWLVREGEVLVSTQRMTPASNLPGTYDAPPDEFVEAAAPCETCHNTTGSNVQHGEFARWDLLTCPDCRIELVEECDTCDGQGGYMYGGSWGFCVPCNASGIIHLGWGYAVGQPLPILPFSTDHDDLPHICVDERPNSWLLLYPGSIEPLCGDDLTDALAHYGPPESLIGKWALQVQVTP